MFNFFHVTGANIRILLLRITVGVMNTDVMLRMQLFLLITVVFVADFWSAASELKETLCLSKTELVALA